MILEPFILVVIVGGNLRQQNLIPERLSLLTFALPTKHQVEEVDDPLVDTGIHWLVDLFPLDH